MINLKQHIREMDLEGFLSLGSPEDEYDSEIAEIEREFLNLPAADRTDENLAAIICAVWARGFGLSDQDMQDRLPEIRRVARSALQG